MNSNNKDIVDIVCPKCRRILATAYKDDKQTIKVKCRYCNKWIWYCPATKETKIKDVPVRTTSSGVTFY